MKLFLDTSSLLKLNHKENDTESIDQIFNQYTISAICLSEITKIEFYATSW